MRCLYIHLAILAFCFSSVAQLRTMKPVKNPKGKKEKNHVLYVGAGLGRSALFYERNGRDNANVNGVFLSAQGFINSTIRLSGEFTHYKKSDIAPTWLKIRSTSYEMNMHVMARTELSGSLYYPILGISYTSYKGIYTGVDDFINAPSPVQAGSNLSVRALCLNLGPGYEYIWDEFSLFGEFKLRLGKVNKTSMVGLVDVCVALGLKYRFCFGNPQLHAIYRGSKSRYKLNLKKQR